MMAIPLEDPSHKNRKRKIRLTFNEEEMIINPEDVDPSVGRFRNLIETTVIPKKVRNAKSCHS
jgi:nuclear inhibitor of protein phosphatase 1